MISVAPTSLFRSTLKPLARSACAYSSPGRNCSGKFFVPNDTVGLPAPGPLGLVVLGWLDDPQPAATTARLATIATARMLSLRRNGWIGRLRLPRRQEPTWRFRRW